MFLGLIAAWQATRTKARQTDNPIAVVVVPGRETYSLGEVIDFNVTIRNDSDREIEIDKPSFLQGNLRLYVSPDRVNYTEYVGPSWGSLDSPTRKTKLAYGEDTADRTTMLYNRTVPHAHLTPQYAERIRKERLDSEFAFTSVGRYWLIAVFRNGKARIESEPVAIDVSEPVGVEGTVWEQMKTDGAYALFLQTGEMKYYPGSQKEADFKEKLRQISVEYPNTGAGRQIGERLIKHDASLENLRKLKLERERLEGR